MGSHDLRPYASALVPDLDRISSGRRVKDTHDGRILGLRAVLAFVVVAVVGTGLMLQPKGPRPAMATYEYFQSEVAWLVYGDHDFAYLQPKDRELWVAPDGSGLLAELFGQADFLGPRAREELASTYQPPGPNQLDFASGSLDPRLDFPTRAESFEMLVSEEMAATKASHALSVLRVARSLLTERIAPSSVRSLLLTELLDERNLQKSCTPDAVSFSIEAGSPLVRYSLTLDRTGALLSDELTLLEPDAAIDAIPPIQIGRSFYRAMGIVDGLGSRTLMPLPSDAPALPRCPTHG